MVYKKGLLTVALVIGLFSSSLRAYEYPSVESVADVQKIYPKSIEEVQKRKDIAKKAFHRSVDAFSMMSVAKHSSRHILQTLDEIGTHMMSSMEALNLISFVEPNDALREACSAAYQELKKDYIQTLSDTKQIYNVLSEVAKKEKLKQSLHDKESYYLKQLLKDMELEGYHLPDKERNQVKDLKIELSKLSEAFSRNIQEDQSSIKVTREALEGLEPDFIEQLAVDSDSNYSLSCDYPTYFTVMKSCNNEETRKNLYRSFMNRAYPKNNAILEDIIAKRDQLAHVLGFQSFAHYQLSNEMVKDPVVAEQFLSKLFESSIQKQKQEIKAFKEVLPSLAVTEDNKLHPWDILYAQQKYKEVRYDLDQDVIKEYFPLETTISGLIQIFESFFNLTMTTVPIKDLWHEDVKLVKIADKKTEQVYGYILLDLFPRLNKYSHACHGTIIPGLHLPGGEATTSLSLVIANFPKSTPSKPSLMTLNDAKTFFHELGHGIHAVMGRTQFGGTSGTSVKVDFVELPSQMLEEWLAEPDILAMISSHYKTKERLPADIIEKIQKTRSISSGQFIGTQCLLSNFALNCFLVGEKKDTDTVMRNTYDKMDLYYTFDPESHHQASFGHLDEYGARYYGYLWSRVFALDVFEQIKKEGLLSHKAGARYVKEILGKGGSEDPSLMLKAYLGREPSQEPFLKAYGIK